ncbi:MAG: PAS domain-containing protein, partial [Candidatus Dormibacteraeota bacterium]|nr:PAS domain-containing protein [Candidatus Dormibacteraeota bacterium]
MTTTPAADTSFEALLRFLYESHGSDFTGYKRSSLMRRVQKRLDQLHLDSYDEYVDYLEVHPDEHGVLLDTILINVTAFFRDAAAWEYLRAEVLPKLVQQTNGDEQIRVWSGGCASGEEAYTIAMLMAEHLGAEAFKQRVKIYATDVDEEALTHARAATYTAKQASAVPAKLLTRYFTHAGNRYTFHKDLRRIVIFGRHDLLQDAPISRIDALFRRNTQMYFNAEAQGRILSRLHFALREGGVIVLGKAEMLLTHANLFVPVDLKRRIFTRSAKTTMRERLLALGVQNGNAPANNGLGNGNDPTNGERVGAVLRDSAFETGAVAQIVVDDAGRLVLANEKARSLFSLSTRDVGRPLQDLEISYRPVELRSVIEQVYTEQRAIGIKDVVRSTAAGDQSFEVDVIPLLEGANKLGVSVTFNDVSPHKRLQNELKTAKKELEGAYE